MSRTSCQTTYPGNYQKISVTSKAARSQCEEALLKVQEQITFLFVSQIFSLSLSEAVKWKIKVGLQTYSISNSRSGKIQNTNMNEESYFTKVFFLIL